MIMVCTTNVFSLTSAYLMSFNNVKELFGIPVPSDIEIKKVKDSSKTQKNVYESGKSWLEEYNKRKVLKNKQKEYESAGKQLPIKTFKTNPKLKEIKK